MRAIFDIKKLKSNAKDETKKNSINKKIEKSKE
jgi:hypothetical protein